VDVALRLFSWYILPYLKRASALFLETITTLKDERVRINQFIRARELRVIGADGENLGVIPTAEAQKLAEEAGLDLIEISPMAVPPVAKIMDHGKYQYELKKRAKEVKAKSHVTETKSVQVKIGTGDHDLALKAKRVAEWLGEGHRVKIDLFLWGRYKYMEPAFLKERLERFLKIIPADYKIADEIKKSPKGFSTTVERVSGKAKS
jgi:translation initiation factor IF-3